LLYQIISCLYVIADVRRCLLQGDFPKTDTFNQDSPVFFVSLDKAVSYAKQRKASFLRLEAPNVDKFIPARVPVNSEVFPEEFTNSDESTMEKNPLSGLSTPDKATPTEASTLTKESSGISTPTNQSSGITVDEGESHSGSGRSTPDKNTNHEKSVHFEKRKGSKESSKKKKSNSEKKSSSKRDSKKKSEPAGSSKRKSSSGRESKSGKTGRKDKHAPIKDTKL